MDENYGVAGWDSKTKTPVILRTFEYEWEAELYWDHWKEMVCDLRVVDLTTKKTLFKTYRQPGTARIH